MFANPLRDLLIAVVLAIVIFGPKRLPMVGRAIGQGLREFKEGITGEHKHDEDERPALTPAAAAEPAPPPAPVGSAPVAGERQSAEARSPESRA